MCNIDKNYISFLGTIFRVQLLVFRRIKTAQNAPFFDIVVRLILSRKERLYSLNSFLRERY